MNPSHTTLIKISIGGSLHGLISDVQCSDVGTVTGYGCPHQTTKKENFKMWKLNGH
jgi:hypothetical protein